jgi:hypothetical protein
MYGTIDKPEGLDPKGEFFCRYREEWMPEIKGKISIFDDGECDINVLWIGIFHKQELKQ